jgi:REP element-mobilizing transposase RayT
MNAFGEIVREYWYEIPDHFQHVEVDAFVIMPNHLHGILVFRAVGARHAVPLQDTRRDEQFGKAVPVSLPTIIRSFKSVCARKINIMRDSPGEKVWQRNYFEHIIRTETSLNEIRRYIQDNPARWHFDCYNPEAGGADPLAHDVWEDLQCDAEPGVLEIIKDESQVTQSTLTSPLSLPGRG